MHSATRAHPRLDVRAACPPPTLPCRHHEYSDKPANASAADTKWNALLRNLPGTDAAKVEAMIAQGMPHSVRGRVWCAMLDTQGVKEAANFDYQASKEVRVRAERRAYCRALACCSACRAHHTRAGARLSSCGCCGE